MADTFEPKPFEHVKGERYCPAWGPGSRVCPRSICDCFIDQFPDDMEQAGALHPEFFTVIPPPPPERTTDERRGLPF